MLFWLLFFTLTIMLPILNEIFLKMKIPAKMHIFFDAAIFHYMIGDPKKYLSEFELIGLTDSKILKKCVRLLTYVLVPILLVSKVSATEHPPVVKSAALLTCPPNAMH